MADSTNFGGVKTGADKLLDLLKGSKEMPLSEAAKRLGVPVQTVEAWANFLEEDGFVVIRYKFTTPYIMAQAEPKFSPQKKRVEEALSLETLELAEVKTELGNMNEMLAKASEHKSAGEFGLLKQTYSSLLPKLMDMRDKLVSQSEISPQRKAALEELMGAFEETLQTASTHSSEGRFDKASESYSDLYGHALGIVQELNKVYEQINMLQTIQQTKDYKEIMEKAYQLLADGKVEEAKELYEKLMFAHENLARDFIENKRQMETDLVKFNKDLARQVDRLNIARFKDNSIRIATLLAASRQALSRSDFDLAEKYYATIKREYGALPAGFADEKKSLQNSILDFFTSLMRQREKVLAAQFESMSRRLMSMISETQQALKEGKVLHAIMLYRKSKDFYGKLPQGFLKEKALLQEKLLPLHASITEAYTQKSMAELKAATAQISTLLNEMKRQVDSGELEKAEASYQQIEQLYRQMPRGFLHEETALQNRIVEVYEEFLKRSNRSETKGLSTLLEILNKFLVKTEDEFKRKDYDAAGRSYVKMMQLYGTLPTGFVLKKIELRERILHLYNQMLSVGLAKDSIEAAKWGTPVVSAPPAPPPAAAETAVSEGAAPKRDSATDDQFGEMKQIMPAPIESTGHSESVDSDIEDIQKKITELKALSRPEVRAP